MGGRRKSEPAPTPQSGTSTRVSTRSSGNREAYKSGRCSECGILMRMSEMEKHMENHKGENPFGCHICSKRFTVKAALSRHLLLHKNDKSFECKECHKKFTGLTEFETHQLWHEKEKARRASVAGRNPPRIIKPTVKTYPPQERKAKPSLTPAPIPAATAPKKLAPIAPKPASAPQQKTTESVAKQQKEITSVTNSIRKKYNLPFAKSKIPIPPPSNQEAPEEEEEEGSPVTDGSLTCRFCQQSFSTLRLHSRHVLIHHKGEMPYKCNTCGKTFLKHGALTQHSMFHTRERKFKCEMCTATFRYHSNLYSHRFTHKEYQTLSCSECGKIFQNYSSLWKHSKLHGNQSKQDTSTNSMENETETNPSYQDAAQKPPRNKLMAHQKKSLVPFNNAVKEEYHTPTFFTQDEIEGLQALPNHVAIKEETYSDGNNYEEQSNFYPIRQQLRAKTQLLRLKTDTSSSKVLQSSCTEMTMCPICLSTFKLSLLQSHMLVHMENKPYKCQYCEKSYSKRFELIQHEYSHTGERPYMCEECGSSFRYKSNYCRHRRMHSVNGKCEFKGNNRNGGNNSIWNSIKMEQEQEGYEQGNNGSGAQQNQWEMFQFAQQNVQEDGEDSEPMEDEAAQGQANMSDPLSDDTAEETMDEEEDSKPAPFDPVAFAKQFPDLIIDEVVEEDQTGDDEYYDAGQYPINDYSTDELETNSQNDYSQEFWCSICDKGFGSQRQFSKHRKLHREDRRVNCPVCLKSFAHKFSLTQHALVHTGIMPFSCEICQKQFRFKSNYTKHNKLHHPEVVQSPSPPHSSNSKNGNRNGQPESLKYNESNSSGGGMNKCEYCEEAFEDVSELRLHTLSHKLGLSYVRTGSSASVA